MARIGERYGPDYRDPYADLPQGLCLALSDWSAELWILLEEN